MKKIAVSVSALVLALGVLSGCGEEKKEAPKAEAPKAETKPAAAPAAPAQAAAPAPAPSSNPMTAMTDAANSAATAMGDAAKAAGTAASQAATSATQAVGDAAKAAGDAATKAADSAAQATGDAATKTADAAAKTATDAAKAAGAVDGEKVYKGLCFSCHDAGVAGAPKLGDKAAWGPRIATGKDALYDSSLKGKNAMPAKGGNPALSDDEVKAAVDFMVSKAQ